MGLAIVLAVLMLVIQVVPASALGRFRPFRPSIQIGFAVGVVLLTGFSAFKYNDAGYCQHVRTIFGTEMNKCDIGWYFAGWGSTTEWPHYITIAHTNDREAGGSSLTAPYTVRMADNWSGRVTQTTRFGIPQDEPQFLKMARDFRSPERLITSTLKPAVTASMDSVANLFTMEEYYAGGKRDEFKTEFRFAVTRGRAEVERIEIVSGGPDLNRRTAPSSSQLADDTAETGGSDRLLVKTIRKLDSQGNEIRVPHGFMEYGIVVSTAILQNLDPDDRFEEQIQARKDAAARRAVAKEKRLEEEENRLFVQAKAEREIAERQGQARVEQIEKTTDAETAKRLALIEADKLREEAKIARETASVKLETAKIDAESRQVAADAEAYEKKAILLADNALQAKLEAYVEVNKVWADAFAKRNVPTTVMGGEGGDTDFDTSDFMSLLGVKAARDLALDTRVEDK